jgi:hypothetical protein
MAARKIEFNAKNVKPFSLWLKKFIAIDQSVLLEIDENAQGFCAKVYNEERSVVKFSKIKFDEAGLTAKKSKDPQRVKVGIYNIARLMKVMDQFGSEEFFFIINYDEVTGDNGTDFAGLSLVLKNKTLKITIDCTSLNIFKYIDDKKFTGVIATLDDTIAKFQLSSDNIEKTNSLCSLDNEYKFMEFKNAGNIYVSGKTFDLLIGGNPTGSEEDEASISIFKDQFNAIDLENYNVEMGDDRLVFTSEDKNTISVISMVEKDD